MATPSLPTLRVDVVSDVACPWCAVGLASLEIARDRLAGELALDLHFQPFELNPQMGPEGEDALAHLSHKYGVPPEQIRRNQATLHERGAAVGFHFGERARIWNTFDAHRLLHWAAGQGRQLDLKRALLAAYHGRGENVGDPAVLRAVAESVGLDGEAAAELLASDRHAEDVRREEQRWQQMGIRSVPSFVIDGRHLLQGGQPPEVLEQALRQVAAASGKGA
ncbi:DsbA family oxidoreductase [Aquabacterium sp. J223]|uniref:DsbA family oxidoreductase n=1 Tax=Aquabacterium sp. J223 TaxID=2898431 RepID=UPI0021ADB71E|nr:DsbA family oxidoreductase [Aquabacterium sp. J223]UUX95673.1 DsbA family oxidoreductase [Aquabacterium sp. J223]